MSALREEHEGELARVLEASTAHTDFVQQRPLRITVQQQEQQAQPVLPAGATAAAAAVAAPPMVVAPGAGAAGGFTVPAAAAGIGGSAGSYSREDRDGME